MIATLQEAIGQIRSQEEAEWVLDRLERVHEGATEYDAEQTPPALGMTPAQTVEHSVKQADTLEKPVVALATAIEQTTGAEQSHPDGLATAVQRAMARPEDGRFQPHRYLLRAVRRRMSPIQALDASLYISVNHLPHTPVATRFMAGVSTVAMHGAAWVLGSLLLAARGGRQGRATIGELLPVLLVTDTLVERIIKVYFRRRRPFITLVKAMVVGRKPGTWSFPSGHSATSFACASVLARRYKRRRPVFYLLASLVAFSRVYLGHHYPTDVLSGATIGEGLSRLVVWTMGRVTRGA